MVMGIFSNQQFIIGILSPIAAILFLLRDCSAQAVPAAFIFGDSLVDAINNNYIYSLSKANYIPNGIDFGQPTGRYTNGRTIVDIIGQELGLKKLAPPYLAPMTVGSLVLHGVNSASGGSGILNPTGKIFGGRINMDAQLDNFANTRQDIISSIGANATLKLFGQSLFAVAMGSNDFLDNYLTPIVSIPEQKLISPEIFVDAMISKYRIQLTTLLAIDHVAKEIMKLNPDFSVHKPFDCTSFLIISLGTGTAKLAKRYSAHEAAKWGLLGSLYNDGQEPLIDIFTHASSDIVDTHASVLFQVNQSSNNYPRIQDDTLTGAALSVDIATKENLLNLEQIGKDLLKKPVRRMNLVTGQCEEVKGAGTNEEALAHFTKKLFEDQFHDLE